MKFVLSVMLNVRLSSKWSLFWPVDKCQKIAVQINDRENRIVS